MGDVERLGSTIMKIITIPAAMQHVSEAPTYNTPSSTHTRTNTLSPPYVYDQVANPIPRVKHPDWLQARLVERSATYKQQRITDFATVQAKPAAQELDIPSSPASDDVTDIEVRFVNVCL